MRHDFQHRSAKAGATLVEESVKQNSDRRGDLERCLLLGQVSVKDGVDRPVRGKVERVLPEYLSP